MADDVVIKIGGDLSPIQRSFAQVRAQAGEIGEKAGLEFGNRLAFRAEERVKRGVEGMLKTLSTAKDPISAIGAVIEGLGSTFRVAGAGLLAFGIGTFLKEQLEEAAKGAQEFYGKTDTIFTVAENSSKEYTEKAVKNFEDAKDAYGKEGLLEWLIYGAGEKAALASGEEAYEAALSKLRSGREAEYKAEADAQSDNAQTRVDGEIEKINQRYDAEIQKAQEAGDSVVEIERTKQEAISKLREEAVQKEIDAEKKLQEAKEADPGLSEADKLKNKQAHQQEDLDAARAKVNENNATILAKRTNVENAQADSDLKYDTLRKYREDVSSGKEASTPGLAAELEKRSKEADELLRLSKDDLKSAQAKQVVDQTEAQKALNAQKLTTIELAQRQAAEEKKIADQLKASRERGATLAADLTEAGLTPEQKLAAQRKKVAEDAKGFRGPQTALQAQEFKNKTLEDQAKLKTLETEAATKRAEETKRRDDLTKQLPAAQSAVATAEANAMGFHGTVSSLRREGFGRTPTAGKDNSQLKAVQASEKHLQDISKEIAQLNAKIGGGA